MRHASILFCLCLSGAAGAQVYKCVDQGKVTYAQAPCPGAQVTQLPAVAPAPAAQDAGGSLERQRQLADKLASARRARESREERERAGARKAAALRFQKCEKLRLRKKWADEDAAAARDSGEVRSLQKKAQRAAEALKVECPG